MNALDDWRGTHSWGSDLKIFGTRSAPLRTAAKSARYKDLSGM